MDKITQSDLGTLLDRIAALINASHARIGFRRSTLPKPPATSVEIEELEKAVGTALPPEYRLFLSIHNGWEYWSGDVALLSTQQILGGEYRDRVGEWRSDQTELGECLVIGFSLFAGEQILLSTDSRSFGAIIVWDYGPVENYRDIVAYFENREKNLNRIVSGEAGA